MICLYTHTAHTHKTAGYFKARGLTVEENSRCFKDFSTQLFHVCFHSLVPSALVLTADFLSLQVSSIFAMNVKIGCQGKPNSKAFNIAFLPAATLLLFSFFFYYSLLYCFICHFPNQKNGKKRKKTL